MPPIALGCQLLEPRLESGPLGPGAAARASLEVHGDALASLERARDVGGLPEPRVCGVLAGPRDAQGGAAVSYTHLRAHETSAHL
eukprot:2072678-Alexandrium_andersonii.AAC.1